MGFPDFYDPAQVGHDYQPDTARAIAQGLQSDVGMAADDKSKVLLLLVDAQIDFVHVEGSLSVPGAVADTRRTIEWIFRNLAKVTRIAASLDSHLPIQVFYPTWWVDADGNHPEPYTAISSEDVDQGRWRPVYEEAWSRGYVQQLQAQAKKDLMIWPYHTMIGTRGHCLTPALYEAIVFHSAARQSKPEFLVKGTIAKTEYYSLLEPEVKVEEDPRGTANEDFLHELLSYDTVYIAGQAKSHCVLETITSVMQRYGDQPEVVRKFHVLMDCTSSVQHPEIDFDAIADEAYADYEQKGLQLVRSTDPIE